MAFLQKKPQLSSSQPLFTLSASSSFLIAGLGNPGKDYVGTRHNTGFTAVDLFAELNDFPGWSTKKELKSQLSISLLGQSRIILAKPTTFMNASGEAILAISQFYKIPTERVLVVYDDFTLDFGSLRMRLGGKDGGHNGVKSIVAHLGPDFGRLRIGIKSQGSPEDPAGFVLAKFNSAEKPKLETILKEAGVLITEFVFSEHLKPETRTVF